MQFIKRDYLLFLIVFFSFSPFLPRLISGIDNQPFVFMLILFDYIFFIKKIKRSNIFVFLLALSLILASFLWNSILGFKYFDLYALLNVILIIVYFLYFNSQYYSFAKIFKRHSFKILVYFSFAVILFYMFNGQVERSLFSYRSYVENDIGRGIYPLSPEPTSYAKILMSFGISCILCNVKFLYQKLFLVLLFLILNGSGMGALGIVGFLVFLLLDNKMKYLIIPIFLILILYIIYNIDLDFLSSKRVFILIDKLGDFNLDYLEMYDMSLANRFYSFKLSVEKFIENPILGRSFTFDSIGGFVSIIGYLGFAPVIVFIYLIHKSFILPRSVVLLTLIFLGLFFFSDSYVLPCFYLTFSFIINFNRLKIDNFYHPASK